jgi:hypothetical protein
MAKRKKSIVDSILGSVESSLESSPEKAVKSQSGSIKSRYEDHAKFAKFKINKEGK